MDVPGEVLLVVLKNSAVASGVIAPRGEEEGEDLTVVVAYNFSNESELPLRNLMFGGGNVTEVRADRGVGDVLVYHLADGDAKNLADAAVKTPGVSGAASREPPNSFIPTTIRCWRWHRKSSIYCVYRRRCRPKSVRVRPWTQMLAQGGARCRGRYGDYMTGNFQYT